jgi:pimeloyl-ACP methyl ester carboxylesterase
MARPRHLEGELVTARRGFFWVGDETVSLPQGTVPRGQMFVQWEAPSSVTKPYPIVLVHGGGGQGTDWLGTPDGRPGWATFLLQEGYAVYVVDRPGHGRAPFHPDALGPMGGLFPIELVSGLFTKAERSPAHATADLHTQWPGSGDPDDPCVRQFAAGTGPMLADLSAAHAIERERGAALLDEIGPAILMTASAGGPMGWLTADARPSLVEAIVSLEPLGPPFRADSDFALDWGLTAAPMTFDPPAASPEELQQEPAGTWTLQAEPARKLPELAGIPIAIVEAEASLFAHSSAATAAFLEQAGCRVDRIVLAEHGVHGNGHLMMLERNSRDALEPILHWLDDTLGREA